MKKVLLSVIIVLLLILSYFAVTKGIKVLKINNINSIKAASNKLENDFNEANNLSNKTYPEEIEGLESAIKELKIAKQKFENKKTYNTEENSIGTVEIKTYKIHYLWTILGNYRKDRGIQSLSLDLKSTNAKDVYDLQFTLMGNYTSITDFIYDIENDEELNFEVKDFVISSQISTVSNTNQAPQQPTNATQDNAEQPNNGNQEGESVQPNSITQPSSATNSTRQKTGEKTDGVTLQAIFTVENIGITLD